MDTEIDENFHESAPAVSTVRSSGGRGTDPVLDPSAAACLQSNRRSDSATTQPADVSSQKQPRIRHRAAFLFLAIRNNIISNPRTGQSVWSQQDTGSWFRF